MSKVSITKEKLDTLAEAVGAKSGENLPLTVDQMTSAVLGIELVNNQNKTTSPTETNQYITPDTGYTGLSSVTVNAVQTETKTITENGTYTPTTNHFFSSVVVDVASGGNPYDSVVFYDYDGSIVASYSKAEFTAMPSNPTHEGLISQGWNWTKAEIDDYLDDYPDATVNVGQMYITDDGKTRLYVHFEEGRTSPYLLLGVNGTVEVDWGDGSSTNTLTGTSLSSTKSAQHIYQSGDYVIKIKPVSGSFTFLGSSTCSRILATHPQNTNIGTRVYAGAIQKIELGSNFLLINTYTFDYCNCLMSITIPSDLGRIPSGSFYDCHLLRSVTFPRGATAMEGSLFYNCYSLSSVTLPGSLTEIGNTACASCFALQSITIPNGVTSIGTTVFNNCYSLLSVIIPNGVTSVGSGSFQNCESLNSVVFSNGMGSIPSSLVQGGHGLKSVVIPASVTTISNSAFNACTCMASITIPNNVTTIGNSAFGGCYGMAEYHFLSTTPPTLGTNVFQGIPSDCIIYVPMASVEAYKTATNWSTYASQIQGE